MVKHIEAIEGFREYSMESLASVMFDCAERYQNCDIDIKYQLHYENDGTEFYTGILIIKKLD